MGIYIRQSERARVIKKHNPEATVEIARNGATRLFLVYATNDCSVSELNGAAGNAQPKPKRIAFAIFCGNTLRIAQCCVASEIEIDSSHFKRNDKFF